MNEQSLPDRTNQPQEHNETPPDLYEARITGSRETIATVLREFELDVGCRHAHVEPNPDRTATLLVYATEQRVRELQAAGYNVEKGENVSALGRQRQTEVGKGDRFDGGRVPSGLGEKRGHGQSGESKQ
jgi:hypothetical protein